MRKHVLVLTTTAAILACGAIAVSAQAPGAQTPGTEQSPTTQATPGAGRIMGRVMMGTRNDGAGLWSRHHGSHGDANNFQSDGR
jgi:hypothetical protein